MSPASAPTDRSICPATMTSTMPEASSAVIDIWRASNDRLRGDRNMPSVANVNTAKMTTSAASRPNVRHGALGVGFMQLQ